YYPVCRLSFELVIDHEKMFLQHVQKFSGLKSLDIDIRAVELFTLKLIVFTLDCPLLERLRIRNASQWIVDVRTRFPKLQDLEIEVQASVQRRKRCTKALWISLTRLMERSIFYRVTVRGHWISFADEVCRYASRKNISY